jgi:hypothetical protein
MFGFVLLTSFVFTSVSEATWRERCVPRKVYDLSLYSGFDRSSFEVVDYPTCSGSVIVELDRSRVGEVQALSVPELRQEVSRVSSTVRAEIHRVLKYHGDDSDSFRRSMMAFSNAICTGSYAMYYHTVDLESEVSRVMVSVTYDPLGLLGGPGYVGMLLYRAVELGDRETAVKLWQLMEYVEMHSIGRGCTSEADRLLDREMAVARFAGSDEAADEVFFNYGFLARSP